MARLDVLRISKRHFLGCCLRVSKQAIAQVSVPNALCLMIINSSDSGRVESCFRGSIMELSVASRIQLDLLCRLSLALNIIQTN